MTFPSVPETSRRRADAGRLCRGLAAEAVVLKARRFNGRKDSADVGSGVGVGVTFFAGPVSASASAGTSAAERTSGACALSGSGGARALNGSGGACGGGGGVAASAGGASAAVCLPGGSFCVLAKEGVRSCGEAGVGGECRLAWVDGWWGSVKSGGFRMKTS